MTKSPFPNPDPGICGVCLGPLAPCEYWFHSDCGVLRGDANLAHHHLENPGRQGIR